jgi:plastocyanin domain-containing protein
VKLLTLAALSVVVMAGCGSGPKSSAESDVQLAVTESGFVPARLEVPRGQPFTLVVTRKTDQICAREILIPALDERRTLLLNQPVRVDVPQGVTDTLNYVCQMHMIGGILAAK